MTCLGWLWIAERAAKGDVRAAAQLRGWRYADQRTQRRLDASLEPNALHLSPATPDEKKTDWSEFIEQRLAAQQRPENLAGEIATARIWTINRTTGDVSYTLNGNRPSPEMSCSSNTYSPRHSVEPENALRSYLICTQNGLFCAWNARACTSIRSSEMLCPQSPGSNTPSSGGVGYITH
jgi:hypothetical protein